MGISVSVAVDSKCIPQQAWRRLYDETLEILGEWPDAPMAPGRRSIAGVEVFAYCRDVIRPEGWSICGDARSRRFAETNDLPSELGVVDPCRPTSDIVLRAVDGKERHLGRVLGNKTQGLPIHILIVAVAMLIEHRFPHAAFVMGDVGRQDAEWAQGQLEAILGEVIPFPLCVDAERLRARLRPHLEQGPALDEVLNRALAPDYSGLNGIFSIFTGQLSFMLNQELEDAVSCVDTSTLVQSTRVALTEFVTQIHGAVAQAKLPPERELANPQAALRIIAAGTDASNLVLTEMAWQEIAESSPAELRLLVVLLLINPVNIGYKIRRACFESPAIRRFCVQAWETAEARARPPRA